MLWDFIRNSRSNRFYLIGALSASFTLFGILKIYYPFPQIIFDSYNYIKAAVYNWDTNAWPIGYSKFLQLFGLFSHSALALVFLQHIFLAISLLYFFFTWRFFFRPGKYISLTLFVLLFLNPLFLFCSNYILSDALFIGLSVLWITELLWIIYQPRPYRVFTNAFLLTMAFTIRYNALYYPLIGAFTFLLSRYSLRWKITGIVLPFLLAGAFVFYTGSGIAAVTGEWQFSPFGSWKLANDAIYAYAHVLPAKADVVPEKFRPLDSTVRQYFAGAHDSVDFLDNDFTSGSFYMFHTSSPLVKYMDLQYGKGWPFLNTKKWLLVSPLYQAYGSYLIRKYPMAFARYFLWPNCLRYITPPPEIFGLQTSFEFHDECGGAALQKWLGFHRFEENKAAIAFYLDILKPFPYLFRIIHLLFIIGLAGFTLCKGFRNIQAPYLYCLLLVALLWLVDISFSLLAAGIVLRYQLFMMIMEAAFGLYFVEYICRYLDRNRSGSLLATPVS